MIFDTHCMHEKYVNICLTKHKNNSFLYDNSVYNLSKCANIIITNSFQLGGSVFNNVNVNVTNLYSASA